MLPEMMPTTNAFSQVAQTPTRPSWTQKKQRREQHCHKGLYRNGRLTKRHRLLFSTHDVAVPELPVIVIFV